MLFLLIFKGFTVGGWYALISDADGMLHTNFSSPVILLSGNGGEFGIMLDDGGHQLVGWVKSVACQGSSSILTMTSRHNQWFHVGLSWFNEEVLLFFNGNLLPTCFGSAIYQEKGEKAYTETQTNNSFLLVIAPPHHNVGYRLAVSIVSIWEAFIDSEMGFADFMGLTRTEAAHFSKASFYWPMSGLLADLAPNRLITSNVDSVKDSRNVDGAAICTTDSKQSYLVLTGDYRPNGNHSNLYYSCLYDITQCSKIIFMLEFHLNGDPVSEDRDITFLTSPVEDSTAGISISVNPVQKTFTLTHRSPKMRCSCVATLSEVTDSEGGWTEFQAFITEKSITLRINDRDLRGLTSCKIAQSSRLKYDSSPFPKIIIGQELRVCVSNVAIIESIEQTDLNPPAIVKDCYPEVDTILPLEGKHPDQYGNPDKATDLSAFTESKTSKKLSSCFNNLMLSCSEFTFSFWVVIKGSEMTSGDSVLANSIIYYLIFRKLMTYDIFANRITT